MNLSKNQKMLLIALVVGVLIYLLFFRNKKDESKKEESSFRSKETKKLSEFPLSTQQNVINQMRKRGLLKENEQPNPNESIVHCWKTATKYCPSGFMGGCAVFGYTVSHGCIDTADLK